ncbi:hypothetical protein SAMN05443668_12432 [Cryptosporangium aurantiacum]|uniref:DUF6318 domain-containing protein n=2 Tax=Cryptosporangium aurantiacum TaxID=134849 RepID=A0A1M7RMJ7_9ACTN|nr:hypothetical protein SAMN05443668_12432 [Cryptosporangium aurantiacum]
MRAARVARAVVALSLGVAALVGCANSDSSSGSVIEPSSAPSSAKLTPPAPDAEAAAHDKAGAAAFTEYWFAVLSYGIQTGEVELLRKVSDPACTACTGAIGVIQENYNDGGSLQGGVYTVREANTIEDFAGEVMTVAVAYDRSPRYGTSPLGVPRGRLDGKSFADCDVRVLWTSSGWKVRGINASEQLI